MGKVVRLLRKGAAKQSTEDEPRKKIKRRRLNLMNMITALGRARSGQSARQNPFVLPQFPTNATPPKGSGMAMDDVFGDGSGNNDWSWVNESFLRGIASVYEEGLVFPGYTYLSELAQRGEYRVIAECIAEEATRKWIKFSAKDEKPDEQKEVVEDPDMEENPDDVNNALDAENPEEFSENARTEPEKGKPEKGADKTQRIKELTDAFDKLQIRKHFQKVSEVDNLFGRAHLYIDIRDTKQHEGTETTTVDRAELRTSIGNGRDDISKSKIGRGFVKRFKVVEPVWTYPTNYDAQDPLSDSWYEPDMWYVMGKEVHSTRLLKFVAREVPDMLKPAYAFGGQSTSQIAKPYIDNWLKIRQSVADIVQAFSIFVLETDLSEVLAESSDALFQRIDLFNALRNNKGLMVINKDVEGFENVAAPLGTLDSIQAQSQEHMAAISRIPIVKLLGIQPAGLNASSEGEIRTFYDHIHAYQERFFRPNLTIIADMVMLSLWGEVDESITFEFVPLWELDAAALATKQKTEMDTDVEAINAGIISPEESRKRIANDPESPHQGLDINDMPEPPMQEGMEGGMPGMEGMANGGEAGTEEDGEGPEGSGAPEGTEGGGLGRGGGLGEQIESIRDKRRGGEGGSNASVVGRGGEEPVEQRSKRRLQGQGNGEAGGLRDLGPENEEVEEDVEPSAIPSIDRHKVTSAAALTRFNRRHGITGDEQPILLKWTLEDLCQNTLVVRRYTAEEGMALDKNWNESDHPRGPDGKFIGYGIAPGLAKKATQLGFMKLAQSTSSGKIKLTHADGSVLVVEPPGKNDPSYGTGKSQTYSFYPADGSKPIQNITGQSGKSFYEKVGNYLQNAKASKEMYEAGTKAEKEALVMGDPEGAKQDLFKASYFEAEHTAQKAFSNLEEVQKELQHNKKFKETADDLGLNAEEITKLFKGEVIKHSEETPKTGNTVAEVKQQFEDGLITHEEMIEKFKQIAGAKPGQSASEFIVEQAQKAAEAPAQSPEIQKQWEESDLSFVESQTATDMTDFLKDKGAKPIAKSAYVQVFDFNGQYIRVGKNGNWFAYSPNQDVTVGVNAKGHGIVELENFIHGPEEKAPPSSVKTSHEDAVNTVIAKGFKFKDSWGGGQGWSGPNGEILNIWKDGKWKLSQKGKTPIVGKDFGSLKTHFGGTAAAVPKSSPFELSNHLNSLGFQDSGGTGNIAKFKRGSLEIEVSGSGSWSAYGGANVGNDLKSLKVFLDKHKKAYRSAKGTTPQQQAKTEQKIAQKQPGLTEEQKTQAVQHTVMKNKMYGALQDKGYGHTPNDALEKAGIIGFKKGDSQFKIANNGDWIAETPNFSPKAGSGLENLQAFLAGEKAHGKKWNTQHSVVDWEDKHDPGKIADLEEKKQKQAAEQQAKQAEAAKTAAEAQAVKATMWNNLKKFTAAAPSVSSETQRTAIVDYTNSGYKQMNGNLRAGETLKGQSKQLQDWLDTASFPEDTILYRGLSGDFANHLKSVMVKGTIFQDKGFTSSTVDPEMGFVQSAQTKLKIHVRKGSKGASVHGISSHKSEGEIIFKAGSQFRVIGLPKGGTKSGESQWVEVELLLPNEHMEFM